MSAVAAIIQPACIHVFADAAFYEHESGILTDFGMKIWPIGGLNAVFSSRGRRIAFPVFKALCDEMNPETFDDLKAALPALFAAYDDMMDGAAGEIFIAGWSEANGRPEVLWRATHAQYAGDGLKPGNSYLWTEGRIAFGFGADLLPLPEAFTEEAVVAAFEEGRRCPNDLTCGEAGKPVMGYSIGGCIQHVAIGTGAMTSQALHEWPDEIGETIDPFPKLVVTAA